MELFIKKDIGRQFYGGEKMTEAEPPDQER